MAAERVELTALTREMVEQIDRKVKAAMLLGYAEVILVVEKGMLRWVRGPAPSEPAAGGKR